MSVDVQLLRESFKLISPPADKLAFRFYEILFERYPGLRPLFDSTQMEVQRRMLLRAIALIVYKVDDTHFLTNYLHGLGKMHVAYGTLPAHYDAFGECLIAALSETAGKEWNKAIEDTWIAAFGVIKTLMIEGSGK